MELYAKCAIVVLGFALAWGYLGQGAGWAVIEGLVGENMAESIWSLINTSELKKNEKPKDTDDAVPTAWSDGELSSEMLVELRTVELLQEAVYGVLNVSLIPNMDTISFSDQSKADSTSISTARARELLRDVETLKQAVLKRKVEKTTFQEEKKKIMDKLANIILEEITLTEAMPSEEETIKSDKEPQQESEKIQLDELREMMMTLIKVKEMEPSEIPIKLQEKMAMAEDKLQMEEEDALDDYDEGYDDDDEEEEYDEKDWERSKKLFDVLLDDDKLKKITVGEMHDLLYGDGDWDSKAKAQIQSKNSEANE